MNERIHQVLDGELSRSELSADEQALLADYEIAVAAVGQSVPRHVAPDLSAGVMARISALESSPAPAVTAPRRGLLERAVDWAWTPRSLTLRPAWGLGLAAAVAAALLIPGSGPAAPVEEAVVQPTTPAEIYVHFRLDAPDASSVHLAGDFTRWQPDVEMHQSQPGVWTVIVPLRAGVHEYAFVVDGERWTADPLGTPVDDGFGGQNSRLSILPPERIRA